MIKQDVFNWAGNNFSIDHETQAQIDVLKEAQLQNDTLRIYPFNPNFISDYKGYTLGMSIEQIDKLHRFRASEKYLNSTKQFQQITGVSDSLLHKISPYFKFPEWAGKVTKKTSTGNSYAKEDYSAASKNASITVKDINLATAEELKIVNGIGDILSARIIKFRDRLGGFMSDDLLLDVYGLEPEIVARTLLRFRVLQIPQLEKINLNTASKDEIASFVYFNYELASRIVLYRQQNQSIGTFSELTEIEDFPKAKIDRIKLYLSL